MSAIYLVTHGEYSDYKVDAVFDSEKLAEEFINAFGGSDEYRIEEYELNPIYPQVKEGLKYYRLRMEKDGSVNWVNLSRPNEESKNLNFIFYTVGGREVSFVITECWAKDQEHAIKIANERRTKAIAENRWGVNSKSITP